MSLCNYSFLPHSIQLPANLTSAPDLSMHFIIPDINITTLFVNAHCTLFELCALIKGHARIYLLGGLLLITITWLLRTSQPRSYNDSTKN